jgi:hypothetical protein
MNLPPTRPAGDQRLGFQPPELLQVDARRWKALRRQMLRMVLGWRNVQREGRRVLESCRHADGCEAVGDRTRPCLAACPDRENWLSALVILGNADEHVMLAASLPRKIDNDYSPPSRETWDALCAENETLRAGRDVIADIEEFIAKNKEADIVPPPPPEEQQPEQPLTRLLPPELEDLGDDELGDGATDDTGPQPGPFNPHADVQDMENKG